MKKKYIDVNIALGKELEFISIINRDGSGTEQVNEPLLQVIQEEEFKVTCLSMSEGTFIATSFNSYVVKLKDMRKQEKEDGYYWVKYQGEWEIAKYHKDNDEYYISDYALPRNEEEFNEISNIKLEHE